MQVLSAKDKDGNELTLEQIRQEWSLLQTAWNRACKEDPTWSMFGGVLWTVSGNEYQVAP